MRFYPALVVQFAGFALFVHAQGLPARVAPTDYQAHAKAGDVTIAGEFTGHSVATPQSTFSSEDFVVVETALFGKPEARLKISLEGFSLRINGKKSPVPSQQFGLLFRSLKDPEWQPPEPVEKKSKTSMGGQGDNDSGPVIPPKMPIELRHVMEQKVQKVSMPEGDRALPVAGLLYFPYRGKAENIQKLELIYEGPAGKATVILQQ
jgi:hypothetical protein